MGFISPVFGRLKHYIAYTQIHSSCITHLNGLFSAKVVLYIARQIGPSVAIVVTPEAFIELITQTTSRIVGRPLDLELESDLNAWFPAQGAEYLRIHDACRAAISAGWMCHRQGGGIKYGRVIEPGPVTHGFSVDVVDMEPIAGPHHAHPNGEIDLIMPSVPGAQFDGHGPGWLVYGPGTAHRPTVTHGRALILYLLPDGAIEFTRS